VDVVQVIVQLEALAQLKTQQAQQASIGCVEREKNCEKGVI
jgi:hypothetical protein